ncbi:MAG: hypothetical protein JKY70_11085 [Mucilaginibacter sp.]|nr:hypothetical protein [Mucilaginibacter sp.]
MQIDKQKVHFLEMAMTIPMYSRDRYFYDSITELFFHTKLLTAQQVALYNFYGFPLTEREYTDVAVRMDYIDDERCEIIEIPRIGTLEKIAIQHDFLLSIKDITDIEELVTAIADQKDDFKMVLDRALTENEDTAYIAPYWDEFKLKVVLNYINSFSNTSGLRAIFD